MRTRPRGILFFGALCCVLAFGSVFAAVSSKETAEAAAPQPPVPMSIVLQNLKINGYELISKVDLEQDVYQIEAFSPQGKTFSITMDAHSGQILSPKQNTLPRVSLAEAVRRVESAGYHDISMVKYSGDKYIVKTLDPQGKKVKLKVNGATGELTKAWF